MSDRVDCGNDAFDAAYSPSVNGRPHFDEPDDGYDLPEPPAYPDPAPLPLVYYRDVRPALESADFVEGLLIEGSMSVVYGESGCGKTFFALDLSLHVAAGMAWRGREVGRGGVLYLALEGGPGVRNRVAAWRTTIGCALADMPFAIVPASLDLLKPKPDTRKVIETALLAATDLALPVKFVVVDTLSRAMAGGNENAPEDMTSFVGNVDRIRHALRAHVMVIHHSGKESARGARGHGSLRAATDTEIEVRRDRESGVSTARITKQRDLDTEGLEFPFSLDPVTLGMDRRGRPVRSCVVRVAAPAVPTAKLGPDAAAALKILRELVTTIGRTSTGRAGDILVESWRERFHERTRPGDTPGTKKKAWQRARDALVEAGIVEVLRDRVAMPGTRGTQGDKGDASPTPQGDTGDTPL